jgi:hypothetical protein
MEIEPPTAVKAGDEMPTRPGLFTTVTSFSTKVRFWKTTDAKGLCASLNDGTDLKANVIACDATIGDHTETASTIVCGNEIGEIVGMRRKDHHRLP